MIFKIYNFFMYINKIYNSYNIFEEYRIYDLKL